MVDKAKLTLFVAFLQASVLCSTLKVVGKGEVASRFARHPRLCKTFNYDRGTYKHAQCLSFLACPFPWRQVNSSIPYLHHDQPTT